MKNQWLMASAGVLILSLGVVTACNDSSAPSATPSPEALVTPPAHHTDLRKVKVHRPDLAPAAPNLAWDDTNRYLVYTPIEFFHHDGYIPETTLGLGFDPHQESTRFACYDGHEVRAPVDNETRYRLEITDQKFQVYVRLSATVIKEKRKLMGAVLKKEHLRSSARDCGDYFVSELDLGGRIQFDAKYAPKSGHSHLPADLPSVLEVGNTSADLAYFESVLHLLNYALVDYDETGAGVHLSDPRSASRPSSELGFSGLSMSMDSLIRYTNSLSNARPDEIVALLQQYVRVNRAVKLR